jgi:glycosyltransferase involved in cell wall biosynthesis
MNAPKPCRLLGLTQGRDVPSTRFRFQQHHRHLADAGFDITEKTARFCAYAPAAKLERPLWLVAAWADAWARTAGSGAFDLCFLQRNLIATLGTWEPLIKVPYVFDVDDAIFVGQRRHSVDRISRRAALVICGNQFLADYFSQFAPVAHLPTAVDADAFVPRQEPMDFDRPVIGWSGTSSGFKYLYDLESSLGKVLIKYPRAVLKIVADLPPKFRSLPSAQVVFEPWSAATEIAALQSFTVGLMPLLDDDVGRGKCSFKMLTYMACGIPYVVSPFGMNTEIIAKGVAGFAAQTTDEWVEAIDALLSDPGLSQRLGRKGRQIVEADYATQVIGPRLAGLLSRVL